MDKILQSKIIQVPLQLSKKLIIPGFDGIPVYDVIAFFVVGIQKSSLTTRASSLAFRFFLALFPSIIFIIAIVPYIPIPNFQQELFKLIKETLPESDTINDTIDDLINNKNEGLLSFGFIFALYLASDGVNSMIMAFNNSYHTIKKVSFIKQRLTSLLLLVILSLLMITTSVLIIFNEFIINYLISQEIFTNGSSIYLLKMGEYLIILLLFFLGISSIYYFGSINNNKFRFISAGSSLATLLTILLSSGFAFYVNNFSTYNKVYGAVGTIMVVMLWLYFNALVLLIGFELNASIQHAGHQKKEID